MKATEQYCHWLLFIMLHKVVETPSDVTIQMKATEQYCHGRLFIMLVDETLVWPGIQMKATE